MYGKTLADYPEKHEAFKLALSELSPEKIDFAFQQAIKTLLEFPTPSQIIKFAGDYYGKPELRVIAEPERKPDSSYVSPAEIQQWKDTALARLAEEKSMNPTPPSDRGKTLHEQQRSSALARLGGSTRPSDPAKLTEWHHRTAVRQGWKPEREPGAEG